VNPSEEDHAGVAQSNAPGSIPGRTVRFRSSRPTLPVYFSGLDDDASAHFKNLNSGRSRATHTTPTTSALDWLLPKGQIFPQP
jgi:hypothetical protein